MSSKSPKKVRLWLLEMLDFIYKIEITIQDVSYEDFASDFRYHDMVFYHVFNLGENANHLPIELKQKFDQVPWDKIVGIRHLIGHNYGAIVKQQVWDIVQKHLRPLKEVVQAMIVEAD